MPAIRELGCLGPAGTFTDLAAHLYLERLGCPEGVKLRYLDSIADVLLAVDSGAVPSGILPIENSLEGSVSIALDMMMHEVDVRITDEIICPISHCLLSSSSYQLPDIRVVISHQQAIAQCRRFLRTCLSHAQVKTVPSTAQAAAAVLGGGSGLAAIGAARAAHQYGLTIIAENIQDRWDNVTRFVIIEKSPGAVEAYPPDSAVASIRAPGKTSLVFTTLTDGPGVLYRVLGEFASRDINLTKIESRPAKRQLGEYVFFIDIEGYCWEPPVSEALAAVRAQTGLLKILGSYPGALSRPDRLPQAR